ncbi:hypothetical protein N9U75_00845 [Pelagibacteraceae bacterium]|nr:hypothetical protein [Pelagibacteraceae bacterium]
MIEKPIVLYTNHSINKTLCYSFAKGSGSLMCHVDKFDDFNKTIATYGYLRGTGQVIRNVKNFYYMDHGYFKQSDRSFDKNRTVIKSLNGYFRVVYNDYWHNGQGSKSDDRLKKLNLNFKNINKFGEYIILSEPTEDAIKYYKLDNWIKETMREIQKYTDRKIILHNRGSKIPLQELLKNAWAFVSDHSSAAFKAMENGVPAYFTNNTLKKIGDIKNIENHEIQYSIFNNLAYEQWTISEIQSGECWQYLSDKIK